MNTNTEQAFPVLKDLRTHEGTTVIYEATYDAHGMTLRDWFAGQALAGIMACPREYQGCYGPSAKSTYAYELADAMIAAREKNAP